MVTADQNALCEKIAALALMPAANLVQMSSCMILQYTVIQLPALSIAKLMMTRAVC